MPTKLQLLSPQWTLAMPLATLVAMLASPPERRLWVAPLASIVFAAMQWILPRSRFRTDCYLGPVNVALFLLLLKLFVVPSLIMLSGAQSRVLSYLPSYASMQNAVLIDMVAYAALCVGLSYGSLPELRTSIPAPGRSMIVMFAILGVIGFVAAFGSPGRLIQYFLDADSELQIAEEASVTALAGTFLRPFLAFALVAWWARIADESTGPKSWRLATLAGLAAAAGITIANLTFSFNRAAFAFPLVSLAAVYSARVRRIPPAFTAILLAIALPLLMAIGTIRASRMVGGQPLTESPFTSMLKDASETVQAYGGGPQFSALFCERTGWGDQLYGGSTLIASAMSPVPVLGKGFREDSGPALFNQALYDVRGIEDQILPFATELFVNFHLPGVVAAFIGLGMLLSASQQWFDSAGSAFAAFSIQYVAMWGAMLAAWSLSIYSQILIYFVGPIYLYLAMHYLLEWLRGMNARHAEAI